VKIIQSTLYHKAVAPPHSSSGPYPTLILLHGRGADENDLLGLAPYVDPRLFIISARAPFTFHFGGHSWYEFLQVGTPEPRQFAESYQRLTQFLADVKQHYPVDAKKIFLLGFSMGAVMSFALSLTRPLEIAGVVAHSGYIPEGAELQFKWNELASTSFFIAHGTHDPVIPIQFGRRANELLSNTPANLTYKEYPIVHQISEKSLSDFSAWLTGHLSGTVD
jgi:phospholipase/carboxylesterase